MQGFQLTFPELYGGTGGGGESLERNYSYPNDTDQTPTCGSGNGASSDILIVSSGRTRHMDRNS